MAAGTSSLASLARAASIATVGALNSTGLLEQQSQARFYSFTTWGGSSYTLNADIYLSVSALINAFLLLGLVSWVLNSARDMALSDKAVYDREDQHQQAATDVIERHRYLQERPDFYESAESDAGYSWLTTTDRPRFEPDYPAPSVSSSEPGSIDDILGYTSKSRGSDPEDDTAADDYHGPYAGYSNYAQYLATVYGYRTGDSVEDSYSQRSGNDLGQVLPHPYRTAKEYRPNNSRERGRQPELAALRDLRPSYGSRRVEKQDRTGGRQRVSLQEDGRDSVNHRASGSQLSRGKPAHPNY